MSSTNLLLTLGHNASAILIRDGAPVIGFEEERLTRVKSSSVFPIRAIQQCLVHGQPETVSVSHWFDDFNFNRDGFTDKHWRPDVLQSLTGIESKNVKTLSPEFTHHDAHAWSALAFFNQHQDDKVLGSNPMIFVCDGFGNQQEVFSAYWIKNGTWPILAYRQYGYNHSLGLLYQYATSWCGMKENQDEYKFLGYESLILKQGLSALAIDQIVELADKRVIDLITNQGKLVESDYISLQDLEKTREEHYAWFNQVFQTAFSGTFPDGKCPVESDLTFRRVVIGFAIQLILEFSYQHILNRFKPTDVIVTGGVHYNVKLNHLIFTKTPGLFCAFPLAGDQGCAIGLHVRQFGLDSVDMISLEWGVRSLKKPAVSMGPPGTRFFDDPDQWASHVAMTVQSGQPINILKGAMEFGPRALCNTSTLALPTQENTNLINTLNGRDTVMPFAPVMTPLTAMAAFESHDRVVGSLKFMITTLEWEQEFIDPGLAGVQHPHPTRDQIWTGRPQLLPVDSVIRTVLDKSFPILINTSFNVHGCPIVYSVDHALADLEYNWRRNSTMNLGRNPPQLAVLEV